MAAANSSSTSGLAHGRQLRLLNLGAVIGLGTTISDLLVDLGLTEADLNLLTSLTPLLKVVSGILEVDGGLKVSPSYGATPV